MIPHLEQVPEDPGTPPECRRTFYLVSGGLRYAATTGYYLTAFQAETQFPTSLSSVKAPTLLSLRGRQQSLSNCSSSREQKP